ncbi:Fic family protein [Calditrichota bacterium GD2]
MTPEQLREIIKAGESLTVEFKTCRQEISRDVYETICAFLNRNGGHIVLGVNDAGRPQGIEPDALPQMKADLITAINNPQIINPPLYLLPEELTLDGKKILAVYIPESSQVHRCKGKIFDRNEDGDLDITNHHEAVANLYIRKQSTFSENKIYPYVEISDLREDLFRYVRKMLSIRSPEHPWLKLDDMELLKSARLYQKDYRTGQQGLTLAAVLLLGKDEVIQSILPHYRTDAILRRINLDRYDDRDDVRTNLIESYERLMAFIQKHLPDPFYLEGDQRISPRERMFREVISNILIHREYLNHYPAKLVIEQNRVLTENANRPHGYGIITPANFSPFPKNPVIARFFREMGRADELGSGVRNLFKYYHAFSDRPPELLEGDIFKIVVDVSKIARQAAPQITSQDERIKRILAFCEKPRSREEIQKFTGLKDRKYFRRNILNPLVEKGLLLLTIPEKPNSPNQKYYSKKNNGKIIPHFTPQVTPQATPQVTSQEERTKRILAFCEEPRSREEIQKFTGLKDRKYFRRNILNPLVEKGLLLLTIPEKPNSPNQKYYSKKNNSEIIPHFTPQVTPQATPQANPQDDDKIEGLNEELKQLLEIIKINPGIQVKDIPALLANRSLKTIERQLKVLKEKSLIERRGSRKTGGYYLKGN